jgi:hypothetical protein
MSYAPPDVLIPGTGHVVIARAEGNVVPIVGVLQFIADADDPWRIVAMLRDALAPGSYLVLANITDESRSTVARTTERVYNRRVSSAV